MSFDPVQPPQAHATSPESLEALGALLRQTREARGLSLSEASHDTFIRTQYLDAMERADLSQLPEVVYVQGFLKRYADYLGLPGETLQKHSLLLFQNPKTPTPASPPPLNPQEPVAISLRPMHLWTIYVVVVVFAVGALSALLEGRSSSLTQWISRSTSPRSQPQDSPAPEVQPPQVSEPVAEQSASTPVPSIPPPRPVTATETNTPQPEDPSAAQVPIIAADQPVKLDIRVVERPSWLRVITDGQVQFEGTLQPGAERNWSADQSIVLRAGNAGGVLITLNDQDLGVMGRFGEVKEQTFAR